MRCLKIGDIQPGMVLARPARSGEGQMLAQSGLALTSELLGRLRSTGLEELWVVGEGESVPDPTVPEYMDRYGPDFATQLQFLFARTMTQRTMQNLYLQALAHAGDCYRRYRLDDDSALHTAVRRKREKGERKSTRDRKTP
jgi:hypothetical protein